MFVVLPRLIVPLGATEAHGPNAPIGEDIFLVTRMAEAVAERTGCTVSEPLWWGSHPYHHLGMPGTVIIPEEVFTGFLRAMIAGGAWGHASIHSRTRSARCLACGNTA